MDVNLRAIQETDLPGSQRAIFDIIRLPLQSNLAQPAKAAEVASRLHLRFAASDSPSRLADDLWDTWVVLVEVVSLIPPDHQWHSILVDALHLLRDKELVGSGHIEHPLRDLPGLPAYVRDVWIDPTEFEENSSQEDFKWRNLNSFIARLTAATFSPWLNLPIWQLRSALEEEPKKGTAMDCRLWVASEWILQCGELVYDEITSNRELDEWSARALGGGPLYESQVPLSLARWQFWMARFQNLSENAVGLELDASVIARITLTVQRMGAIRDKHGE
ncbi:hypothetical protein B0T10DRAFT_497880 [Thelonectria olida]|uniref:Uncharacterized protein n=1 Tax=Thelonectria olida TaxID=1576542 RepID=A0A9P9AK07_9HYPO|nr:hypothetical protein B0T10DRAFT_497880 [Thelonectria olida]